MTGLAERLGLRERELVAFVGAGGKSTTMFRLGSELAAAGRRVVLTTTTKMGSDQARRAAAVCRPARVAQALTEVSPVLVVAYDDGRKVTGPSPDEVGVLFFESGADHVLVEADGARGRSFKTPAEHEPVIPAATTLVVIVVGADALDRPIAERCHRPELVASLAGLEVGDPLDVDAAVRVLIHPSGVLRAIPLLARVVVAVTKVDAAPDGAAVLQRRLGATAAFDRIVAIGRGRD